jgi:hypothetical protein
MFCDAYNKPLTEAVAAGRELTPALQKHLSECESCRSAFAEEQSLFATIDVSLRAAANAEVPATLIPRVHVALNNESAQSHSHAWIFASAAATAILVAAIVISFAHRDLPSPRENVANQTSTLPSIRLPQSQQPNAIPDSTPRQTGKAKVVRSVSVQIETLPVQEVLVPDEERAAFARFLESGQSEQTLATASATIPLVPEAPKVLLPLQPVEVASLKISSLNGDEASRDDF